MNSAEPAPTPPLKPAPPLFSEPAASLLNFEFSPASLPFVVGFGLSPAIRSASVRRTPFAISSAVSAAVTGRAEPEVAAASSSPLRLRRADSRRTVASWWGEREREVFTRGPPPVSWLVNAPPVFTRGPPLVVWLVNAPAVFTGSIWIATSREDMLAAWREAGAWRETGAWREPVPPPGCWREDRRREGRVTLTPGGSSGGSK